MDEQTRKFLEGVYPYFKILEKLNDNLQELISTNVNNEPYKNEELFYLIASDLIRLFPVKIPWKKSEIKGQKTNKRDYANAYVEDSGIMLLKNHMTFLETEYGRIIDNRECKKAFAIILLIRNKYIHEPHNIRYSFSVGSKTSCSMNLYYKNTLLPVSTIWITNIVYELNSVFEKIKEEYIKQISLCDEKYKGYPCYKTICNIDPTAYNKKYTRLPWGYIALDDDFDLEDETK